jgi:hypothetical protein
MQDISPDALTVICGHMDSTALICNLSRTCKSMNRFFTSNASKNAWHSFVLNMCGYSILDDTQPLWYRAMITMCPYLAVPEILCANFDTFGKFEIARTAKDNAPVLWCEKGAETNYTKLSGKFKNGRETIYSQFTGKKKNVIAEKDLVFNEKPQFVDNIDLQPLNNWAQFHEESEMVTSYFSFHQDPSQTIMQIHKSLFVACISVGKSGTVSRKRVLVFFTKVGHDSIKVLYTIKTHTGEIILPGGNHTTAFIAFDKALLCVKTGVTQVTYYGPKPAYGSGGVYTSKTDPSVTLRRILAGEPTHVSITDLIRHHATNDTVTNWPIMRCVLESRNKSVGLKILDHVKTNLGPFTESVKILYTESDGHSMLPTAIKTGDRDTVRFLVENGAKIQVHEVVSLCMDKPEMVEIIIDKMDLTLWDAAYDYHLTTPFTPFGNNDTPCEPVLHVLKRKEGSLVFKNGKLRFDIILKLIHVNTMDPGLLVMNARFLRTLILEGEALSKEQEDEFITDALQHGRVYMAILLASMGMKSRVNRGWCMSSIPEPTRSAVSAALDRMYQA